MTITDGQRQQRPAGSAASGNPTPAPTAAIQPEHVQPVFQPIVDLLHGEIAGFEALSRPTPLSTFTDAGQMFDWAESNGTLWPLEDVTRNLSLSAARDWPVGIQLFLNTSPQVFSDDRFAQTVLDAVQRIPGLTPGRVVLEITERSEQQYSEGLEAQVLLVKQAGFQIAIDDVGAGTSGFNRIMSLRPNWLKLDRALVEKIDQDRTRQNLLRFFLHFARLSGVKLIAEGIEREAELATLVDLGVPFGQGYYLGRPGSREQTLDPRLSEWLRGRWSRADAVRYRDPRHVRVERFARPVETVSADQPVREIAGRLLRNQSASGVAVMEGRRYAGWCERDQILRAAADARSAQPIGFLVGPDPVTATPETTVTDAMDLALARDDRSVGLPLVILDKGEVTGMVTVRDMLHAAADMVAEIHPRTAPLTGLPGRVRCDEHIDNLISRTRLPRTTIPEPAYDAAFIDIRAFHDYNGAYGYDLGDQLLKRLSAMIQFLVHKGDDAIFVGHLGDDRFLVTAQKGVLRARLERLLRQFDRTVQEFVTDSVRTAPEESDGATAGRLVAHGPARVGLRAVLVADAFSLASTARELYRLGDEAKGRSHGHSAEDRVDSVLIETTGTDRARKLLSA